MLHSRRQKELESSAPRGENNVKMKALQETILRMNEKNLRLTTENKTLKLDLEKVLEDSAKAKDNQSKFTSVCIHTHRNLAVISYYQGNSTG